MNRVFFIVLFLLSGFHADHARAQPKYTPQELVERLTADTHWSAELELAKRFGEAREAIMAGLKHSNPAVRRSLVGLITRSRDRSFYPELLLLAKDPDRGVRQDVLEAAIEWGGDNGRQIAREMLQDIAPANRGAAVMALWKLDRTNALPEIIHIVEADTDTARAGVAVLILARRGDIRVREKAVELTKSAFESTRADAVESLGYIGSASDIVLLKSIVDSRTESRRVKTEAWRAANQLEFELKGEAEKRAILVDSLRSADRMKRRWAAVEYIRRGDAASLQILRDVSKDRTHPGRGEAMDALDANK